jgi:predicted alpha-1,2-mannosidase
MVLFTNATRQRKISQWSWPLLTLLVPVLAFLTNAKADDETPKPRIQYSDYVRPLVGTAGGGNTFPGTSAPFGMVQFSPDTDREAPSGYQYSDTSILGFSLTHLTGTGVPDLGDFLFTTEVGAPKFVSGTKVHPEVGYRSRYSHADEIASAGYYKVKLQPSGVIVELTAGERAGFMRFTFPASDQSAILTDLNYFLWPDWDKNRTMVSSEIHVIDNQTITGFHLTRGWASRRYLYFAARYSRPFDHYRIVSNGSVLDGVRDASGKNLQFLAQYKTAAGEIILVKAAVSAVSADNALKNLDAEIPDWNFERVLNGTRDEWNRELSKIQIQGSQEEMEAFYTSLYHTLLAPNVYEDVTGEYRGLDQKIHQADGFTNYTVLSLWDIYRAECPLFTLIEPGFDTDMINSMLAHYDQSPQHMLPIWPLQANETWCMIGYHAVPVIVDGYLKNVKGFDALRAYEACKTTAINPDYSGLAAFNKLGWVPYDKYGESVSKTLEYAYDDWCIAQMAKALGKVEDYEYFIKRAGNFTNVFDPVTGVMRPKDSQGNWRTPFDPHHWTMGSGGDYTEATAWQYTWYVPQDVPKLIELMGGPEQFAQKLDSFFSYGSGETGEYDPGNEPDQQAIYLYSYAGEPWKAVNRLRQVMHSQYGNKPNSLPGNDDCGQMSVWYVFTAMGFYPVCPASNDYVIGSPTVKKAVMYLSNGKTFTMTAENLSNENIYVQSAQLDGKDLDNPFLPYDKLKNGGTLDFVMGDKPSQWGIHPVVPE